MEYPLITKRLVKENKILKDIQKEDIKNHKHVKGKYPKAKLGKLVKLKDKDGYIDCVNCRDIEQSITLSDFSPAQIVEVIHDQEIYGFGGAAFPTWRKLEAVKQSKQTKKYFIINAVACDPGLLHDKWLIENHLAEIEIGVEIIGKYLSFEKVILATKEDGITLKSPITVQVVPNRYPIGAERILLKQVLDISLGEKEIPADHGVLVLNVQTIYAIYKAFYQKEEKKTKYITVANMDTGEAVVAKVSLGQTIIEILDKAFVGQRISKEQVYYGGGIMLGTKANVKDTITEKINFICFGKVANYQLESPCKKCGACTRKCPVGIKVNKIIQAVDKQELDGIEQYHPETCLQCGACSYYCKAGKNTMNIVNQQKERILSDEK